MEKRQVIQMVASNLKVAMSEQGISSTELAKRCNISSGTISKITSGHMSLSVPMIANLAEGLGVPVSHLMTGLDTIPKGEVTSSKKARAFSIGVMSINNMRVTCIKDSKGKVIGTSELEGGLDLTETSGHLIDLIQESIHAAVKQRGAIPLKNAHINLVTQSYEFEETRDKFLYYAKRFFKDVILMSDWQITYLASFDKKEGISLITDKGVSLSYRHEGILKKLGGWKFPVYDLGGENWLGVETIRHTIEAVENYTPMSNLARTVLAKYSGKIERITEACFKGDKNPDIYSTFCDLLIRCYFLNDAAAKAILERGFRLIYQGIEKVDAIMGKPLKIAMNGSLATVYAPYFKKERLMTAASEPEKVSLLADLTKADLIQHGIQNPMLQVPG